MQSVAMRPFFVRTFKKFYVYNFAICNYVLAMNLTRAKKLKTKKSLVVMMRSRRIHVIIAKVNSILSSLFTFLEPI